MSSKLIAIVVGLILLVSLLTFSMTYSVRFNEQAIVTTFGEPSRVVAEPGLHFKWPAPIQAVKTYDSRLQMVDTRLETQATKDGLQVVVQTFIFWEIAPDKVLEFDRAYGSVDQAGTDIAARIRAAVGALSEFDFDELIGRGNRMVEAENRIKERLVTSAGQNESLEDFGVNIKEVGISQIILPSETTRQVVERMKNERDERAETARTSGEAEALRIKSDGTRHATTILVHANRLADRIRAKGDALAETALTRMSVDPEFAIFLIWLDALEKSTAGATTYIMPTNFAPFHLLNWHNYGGQTAIPQPETSLNGMTPRRGASSTLSIDPNLIAGTPGTPVGADESDESSTDGAGE